MKIRNLTMAVAIITAGIIIQQSQASPSNEGDNIFDIENYAWLAGHWTGDGFGGTSEEVWTKPKNGVIMGMYRHHDKDGKLVFYEFITLDKTGMKLKHFNADLTGWETKDKFMTFEMVEAQPNKLILDGLVYEKKSDSEMEVTLKYNPTGKKVETEIFNFKKTPGS